MGFTSTHDQRLFKLFYGLFVRFKINDIIEGSNLKQHSQELSTYNRFQQLLSNFKVEWNLQNEQDQFTDNRKRPYSP